MTTPTYAEQARACWKCEEAAEQAGKPNLAAALNAAGTTCHNAAGTTDALTMASDIFARLWSDDKDMGDREVADLIHSATIWMSLYGKDLPA